MRKLEAYHLVWLAIHPWRTEEWLRDKLADGFDIHHIDGDHSNDGPGNLVLIDHADHFMLHGSPIKIGRIQKVRSKRLENKELAHANNELAWSLYHDRQAGKPWHAVAAAHKLKMVTAIRIAERYAKRLHLQWPLMPKEEGRGAKQSAKESVASWHASESGCEILH